MTLGHFGTASRAPPPTQRPRRPSVVRPAPYPPPKRRRNLLMLLSGGDPTFVTSPYASSSVGQVGNPSGAEEVLSGQAGLAQPLCSSHSQREATVVTTRLFEEGTMLSSSSRFETSALRRPPACRAALTFGSETSSAARRRARTGGNRSTAGIVAGGDDLPPTVPQGDGVHQAQGDRDSTMSGSVEATTAIALKRMSSETLASRMAATRWLATAARSSWLIPRPAWAWSSGRPS